LKALPSEEIAMADRVHWRASRITSGRQLFAGCVFWVPREVPRSLIELVILSCGGKLGWEDGSGSPYTVTSPVRWRIDGPWTRARARIPSPLLAAAGRSARGRRQAITHQLIDRPAVANLIAGRDYIQPQWVFDCLNAQRCVFPRRLRKPAAFCRAAPLTRFVRASHCAQAGCWTRTHTAPASRCRRTCRRSSWPTRASTCLRRR